MLVMLFVLLVVVVVAIVVVVVVVVVAVAVVVVVVVVVVLVVLQWMEEILHHLHSLFRVHIQATTPHPLFNIDDRSLGAVQDLCHWNDFVKPRVHSNVKKGAWGETI